MRYLTLILTIFLSSCKDEVKYYGYLEGKYVYLACEFSGKLKNIFVKKGSIIKKGDILYEIDDQNEVINIEILTKKIEAAKSNIQGAQEDFLQAEKSFKRKEKLNNKKIISTADFDKAYFDYINAEIKLKTLYLNLTELESNLKLEKSRQLRKVIYSEQSGFIADVYFSVGEFVTAGTPVVSILPEEEINVIFFVPQNEFQKFRMNHIVNIYCGNCAKDLKGKISFISSSPEFTPPNIYSSNFREELVFRIEANIEKNDARNLNVGQPAYVRLNN